MRWLLFSNLLRPLYSRSPFYIPFSVFWETCVCNCFNTCSFLSWAQGFSNKNFGFINNQTVCYPCGNYILFLDIKTKKTTALQCQTGQVGAFAVNPNRGVLAFSDRKLNPVIYIYCFPELNKLTELKGSGVVTVVVTISLKQSFKQPVSEGFFFVSVRLEKLWQETF